VNYTIVYTIVKTIIKKQLENGVFARTGSVWPRISGESGCLPATIFPVRKLNKWAFYMVLEFRRKFFFVSSQFARLTDRRTEGETDISLMAKTASAVKMKAVDDIDIKARILLAQSIQNRSTCYAVYADKFCSNRFILVEMAPDKSHFGRKGTIILMPQTDIVAYGFYSN